MDPFTIKLLMWSIEQSVECAIETITLLYKLLRWIYRRLKSAWRERKARSRAERQVIGGDGFAMVGYSAEGWMGGGRVGMVGNMGGGESREIRRAASADKRAMGMTEMMRRETRAERFWRGVLVHDGAWR